MTQLSPSESRRNRRTGAGTPGAGDLRQARAASGGHHASGSHHSGLPAGGWQGNGSSARPARADHDPVDRRGRHATPTGQDFGYVVGWTIAGALVPGSGLLAAGRRAVGTFFLTLSVVLGLASAVFALYSASSTDKALSLAGIAFDPRKMLYLAIMAGMVGAIWAVLIVGTHVALRRDARMSGRQQAVAWLLTALLIVGVAVPSAQASHLALIQRDLINTVFAADDGDPAPAKSARPQEKHKDPWANTPRVNVLLIGGDDDETRKGVRPDTLILASINTKTGDTVLFNLPRQLHGVPFPEDSPLAQFWPNGYRCYDGEIPVCLLNSVWMEGENRADAFPKGSNAGLLATRHAVTGATGLTVDYYFKVNMDGFKDFIDAIGGVRLNVPRDLPIGGGTNPITGGQNPITGYVKAGKNRKLNGHDALWFARSRADSDNWDRMARQQCVVAAVTTQADPLTLMRAYPRLAASAKRNITTDIPQQDLQSWVELTLRVKKAGSVRSLQFTPENMGGSADHPDFNKMHEIAEAALAPPKKSTSKPKSSGSTATTTSPKSTSTASPSEPADPEAPQDVAEVC